MTTIPTKLPVETLWNNMTPGMAEIIKAEISEGGTFIAGGAPLNLVYPDKCPLKDFDVYHTFTDKTADFISALSEVPGYSSKSARSYNSQPQGDTSIMMIITFRTESYDVGHRDREIDLKDVQIMICADAMRDIRWFDFTCCSVFFDGESVKAFWPKDVLEKRLCGLAGDPATLKQNLRRPLCRRCMAGKGIREPVYCYLPAHLTVCHRHRRWVGPLAQTFDDQLDLRGHPQVLRAARTHWRLANRYAELDLRAALGDARHMLVYWAHAERRETATILQGGLHAHVSAYPEVISIAATLLTARPQIEHPSGSTSSASTLLIARISERTTAYHNDDTPVEQWIHNRRQTSKVSGGRASAAP